MTSELHKLRRPNEEICNCHFNNMPRRENLDIIGNRTRNNKCIDYLCLFLSNSNLSNIFLAYFGSIKNFFK